MSVKAVGLYGGVFFAALALALVVTGTFQHGILPRIVAHLPGPARDAPTAPPLDGQPTAAEPAARAVPDTPTPILPQSVATRPAAPAATPPEAAAHVKRLARMYEGMRPKEAAAVLEKLDRPLAAQVLMEIRERQAAKILGALRPAAAAELTRLVGQAPSRPS